jgi:hypothetical protein
MNNKQYRVKKKKNHNTFGKNQISRSFYSGMSHESIQSHCEQPAHRFVTKGLHRKMLSVHETTGAVDPCCTLLFPCALRRSHSSAPVVLQNVYMTHTFSMQYLQLLGAILLLRQNCMCFLTPLLIYNLTANNILQWIYHMTQKHGLQAE